MKKLVKFVFILFVMLTFLVSPLSSPTPVNAQPVIVGSLWQVQSNQALLLFSSNTVSGAFGQVNAGGRVDVRSGISGNNRRQIQVQSNLGHNGWAGTNAWASNVAFGSGVLRLVYLQ